MSQRRAEPPRRRRRNAGAGTQGAATAGPTQSATPEAAAPETADGTAQPVAPNGSDGVAPRKRPRRRRGRGGRGRGGGSATPAAQGGQAGKQGKPAGSSANAPAKAPSKAAPRAGAKAPGTAAGKQQGRSGGKGAAANGRGERKTKRTWMRRVDEFSAGGLVLDMDGDVPRGALIGRTDKLGRLLWSLPKGHIEEGETAEQAAVREVKEETGISGVIVGELGTIDFWFVAEGRRIHKTVRHFLMRAVGGELSDADVEVTAVAWVPLPEISDQLAYPDERGLVETAGRMLAESA